MTPDRERMGEEGIESAPPARPLPHAPLRSGVRRSADIVRKARSAKISAKYIA